MASKSIVDQHYTNLCTTLGDLTARKTLLSAQIAEIIAEIKALNNISGNVRKLEVVAEKLQNELALKDVKVSTKGENAAKA